MTSVVQEAWENCLLCNPLSERNERAFPGEDGNRKKHDSKTQPVSILWVKEVLASIVLYYRTIDSIWVNTDSLESWNISDPCIV